MAVLQSEVSCKTQPFETVAEKIFIHPVMLGHFVNWWKVFTVITLKIIENHQLYATAATPTVSIEIQTVTDGISRRVTSGRENTSLITESRLLKAVIVMWCCYNSYCPQYVRSQTSSAGAYSACNVYADPRGWTRRAPPLIFGREKRFLPRDAKLARYMLSFSVCLSVCLSDTSRHCTKTAKHRITQTTPYDSVLAP